MTNKKGDTTGDKEAEGRQGGHNDQQEGKQEEGEKDKTDTVTNKKGEKTGDKKKQKEDKADTMRAKWKQKGDKTDTVTTKKGDKTGDKGRQK